MTDECEELKKGLVEGFGLFAGELLFSAWVLAAETTTSATGTTTPAALIVGFTLLVSLLSFLQSVRAGKKDSDTFLFGFFIGSAFALGLAWQLSDPMMAPVAGGIIAEIAGTVLGLFLR